VVLYVVGLAGLYHGRARFDVGVWDLFLTGGLERSVGRVCLHLLMFAKGDWAYY
jgi:hypothetical protein